jgi:hypothetical protein
MTMPNSRQARGASAAAAVEPVPGRVGKCADGRVGVGISVDRHCHVVHGGGNRGIGTPGSSGPGQGIRGYDTSRPSRRRVATRRTGCAWCPIE